ncbi:DUF7527 domain-containing protein [Natronorubrum texcoconense]|uniref:DUF7527 domain-containing protein n=1 Tax=Natronorubrum texcoconense TaxID=1095776 RepID=A0A1G8XIL3_9EURY|nr:transcriptional regulator [Natronorubrum texcoconense]SDJ90074.1 hypothetical protein SAMN04515672_1759 [Natronorubrum texcoconense]
MDSRTQERAEQWDSRPFSGGYDGLTDLAASEFSGAVAAAGTWLFMLNGRIVGVVDGTIEDFETASGTVYEAPHPSLPLLCAMETQGGETRAKYYTNETPLREVDGTLQEGSFTGYVELSENVLSGDYYAVYYGGRRMAAAYIGNAERLLTGDEAFDRADDEVGIYEVRDVDIDVTDVPGTAGADADESAGTTTTASPTDADSASTDVSGADPAPETASDADSASEALTGTEPGTGPDTHAEPSADPTESAIESIDISGSEPTTTADETTTNSLIDDVAFDDVTGESSAPEETGEPSGITTADESALDASSSGITAPESEPDASSEDSLDAGTDSSVETEPSTGFDSSGTAPDESVSTSFDEAATESPETDSEPVDSPTESVSSARAGEAAADRTVVPDAASESIDEGTDADEQPSSAESDTSERTSPDLAEVEAAAEQLDQNDISWTEDDVDSADDASEESEPAEPTESADGPNAESKQQADPEDERFEEEAQWRETRSIPSIDPDNSQSTDAKRESTAGRGASARTSASGRGRSDSSTGESESSARETSASTDDSSASSSSRSTSNGSSQQHGAQQRQSGETSTESGSNRGITSATGTEQQQRIATLTQQLETLQEQRDALVTKAEELETERDQLRSENQELTSTVDRLQSRIKELEAELQRARESAATTGTGSDTPAASTQLPPQRALAETNLFVRYGSKSQPTLETAHDGDADKAEVASNLQLEHHTSFDAADVAVDGDPYEEFLSATMEYRFVDWLTETVLYEIRDTGNGDALGDLYDAIPRIDRAELGASISLADDETEDVPDEVTFDVVAFDKMGNPLVVANLNDSRDPATQGMLEEMEEAASAVKANYPDLAASVVVTSSYFEPGALEVADQATSGGFLSRGSKLSYVNLSRKEGYHLCLVESRSEGFHMNVPEL